MRPEMFPVSDIFSRKSEDRRSLWRILDSFLSFCNPVPDGNKRGIKRKGVAAIEFAILAPVLLMLLIGIVEVGRMFWIQHNLEVATKEGARYAAMNKEAAEDAVRSAVVGEMNNIDSSPLIVTLATQQLTSSGKTTTLSVVESSYEFSFLSGLIPGGNITLTARSISPQF
jgi:hypothetical protein